MAECPFRDVRDNFVHLLVNDASLLREAINDAIFFYGTRPIKVLPVCSTAGKPSTLEHLHLCGHSFTTKVKIPHVCDAATIVAKVHELQGLESLNIDSLKVTSVQPSAEDKDRLVVQVHASLFLHSLTALLNFAVRDCSRLVNVECGDTTLTAKEVFLAADVQIQLQCMKAVDATVTSVTVMYGSFALKCGLRGLLLSQVPQDVGQRVIANAVHSVLSTALKKMVSSPTTTATGTVEPPRSPSTPPRTPSGLTTPPTPSGLTTPRTPSGSTTSRTPSGPTTPAYW